MNTEIIDTLRLTDNEGTSCPFWMIVDTGGLMDIIKGVAEHGELPSHDYLLSSVAMSAIEAPFFSRQDAEDYLKARRYAYTEHAKVWCSSGYRSRKYKKMCTEIGLN